MADNILRIAGKRSISVSPRPYIERGDIQPDIQQEQVVDQDTIMTEDYEKKVVSAPRSTVAQVTNLPSVMVQSQAQPVSILSSKIMGVPIWALAFMIGMAIYIVFYKGKDY